MEHPAEPSWAPWAPSSWQLPELQHLVARLGAREHYIDQCMAGAPHKKPTQLLAVGLSTLQQRIDEMAGGGVCDRSHTHAELVGLDEHGFYRTAAAKEYPPKLCEIMARAVLDAAEAHLSRVPHGDPDYDEDLAHFYVPLDPYATFVRQHDCAAGVPNVAA